MSSEAHEPAAELVEQNCTRTIAFIGQLGGPAVDAWHVWRCSVCDEPFAAGRTIDPELMRPIACPHCGVRFTQTKIHGEYIER
jgi:DNA-directed RNA polymerase subunit RPC12/RpoP